MVTACADRQAKEAHVKVGPIMLDVQRHYAPSGARTGAGAVAEVDVEGKLSWRAVPLSPCRGSGCLF